MSIMYDVLGKVIELQQGLILNIVIIYYNMKDKFSI